MPRQRAFVCAALAAAAAVFSFACKGSTAAPVAVDPSGPSVIAEAFLTPAIPDVNIDSVAVWRRAEPALLVATAKTGNTLLVYNAATGEPLRRIGSTGVAAGQLRRPNGILILDDYAFVVERDNHRIQVFSLPGGESRLVFGDTELRRPYGITGYVEDGAYVLFVTDNYETPEETYPPDSELGSRVHRFRVSAPGGTLTATHERAFGDTSGPGVLKKVETIVADRVHQRVLVAEEDAAVRSLQIYTPEGRFTGKSIQGWFATEPEGVAMYPCGDDGLWIATDQNDVVAQNIFHVFDRRSLEHRGAFRGAVTHTTDGVALTRGTLGALDGGVFYALHNDQQVAAFSWSAIATALKLETCNSPLASR